MSNSRAIVHGGAVYRQAAKLKKPDPDDVNAVAEYIGAVDNALSSLSGPLLNSVSISAAKSMAAFIKQKFGEDIDVANVGDEIAASLREDIEKLALDAISGNYSMGGRRHF